MLYFTDWREYRAENCSSVLEMQERSRASFGGYTSEDILMWGDKMKDAEYIPVHDIDGMIP